MSRQMKERAAWAVAIVATLSMALLLVNDARVTSGFLYFLMAVAGVAATIAYRSAEASTPDTIEGIAEMDGVSDRSCRSCGHAYIGAPRGKHQLAECKEEADDVGSGWQTNDCNCIDPFHTLTSEQIR